ncbi:MAG: hypothetical protein Q7S39_06695 [Ignavibacteria bacterium]|nr:hypothetical protein [Ignavibacteria bacterium]
MAKISIIIGVLLIILGLYGYFGLNSKSVTALIPAFVGLPLLILGWFALNEKYRKNSMHIAAVIALLGFIGSAMRAVPALFKDEITNKEALTVQLSMSILCLIFVLLAGQSFIKARRSR